MYIHTSIVHYIVTYSKFLPCSIFFLFFFFPSFEKKKRKFLFIKRDFIGEVAEKEERKKK